MVLIYFFNFKNHLKRLKTIPAYHLDLTLIIK